MPKAKSDLEALLESKQDELRHTQDQINLMKEEQDKLLTLGIEIQGQIKLLKEFIKEAP